jgi:hypothetical protein
MCGIVGYTGPREAYPIIIKGLKDWNNIAAMIVPAWLCKIVPA